MRQQIGDRSGHLEIVDFVVDRSKFRRPRTEAICVCHKCQRNDYKILPYNFVKQKSCGCDRTWNPPPSGQESKLYQGYKEMPVSFFYKAKKRAEKKRIPFALTQRLMWELYEKQHRKCALSGLPIFFPCKGRVGEASLDRIDSTKGYTLGNVQWVHKDINLMKMFLGQEYFLEMCRRITTWQARS